MSTRHAAALALVGWYLMTPPGPDTGQGKLVDINAALSKWTIGHVYDKAADCESQKIRARNEGYDLALKMLQDKNQNPVWGARSQGLIHAECIATDDPRLKEK